MTTDTRDRIKAAARPGWKVDPCIASTEIFSPDHSASLTARDDGLCEVHVGQCAIEVEPIAVPPAYLRELAAQLVAVADALEEP